jgi:hypothetical protein
VKSTAAGFASLQQEMQSWLVASAAQLAGEVSAEPLLDEPLPLEPLEPPLEEPPEFAPPLLELEGNVSSPFLPAGFDFACSLPTPVSAGALHAMTDTTPRVDIKPRMNRTRMVSLRFGPSLDARRSLVHVSCALVDIRSESSRASSYRPRRSVSAGERVQLEDVVKIGWHRAVLLRSNIVLLRRRKVSRSRTWSRGF